MREEIAYVFVEPNKNVLNLAAARAESVAHIIQRGITHREEIGPAGFAKMQSVDCFVREFGESGIGVRAGGPLAVKRGVG